MNVKYMYRVVKHEIRDRFSGAMEAFARRNGSSAGLQQGDHSRNRSDDVPTSKDVVGRNCLKYFPSHTLS